MTNKFSTSLPWTAQQVMRDPADYEMTAQDKTLVSQGKAFWILGSALAKIKLICASLRTTELMVFLLAKKDNPYQVVDVLIPKEQFANSAAVLATGGVVLRANREARAMDCIIVAAAHSHALMSVFSSSTDLEYMRQLNEEEVGYSSQTETTLVGRLADLRETAAAQCSGAQIFEARFDDQPLVSIEIATNREDLAPGDLKVSLTCRESLQISSFQTFNADGDWFAPAYKISRCPWCRSITREATETDVAIHVVGEEVLGHRERQEFLAQTEQRAHATACHITSTINPLPGRHAGSARPADFVIWRHGKSHHISAEIIEEAAYRCDALAKAMGWQQPDKNNLNAEDERATQPDGLPETDGNREGGCRCQRMKRQGIFPGSKSYFPTSAATNVHRRCRCLVCMPLCLDIHQNGSSCGGNARDLVRLRRPATIRAKVG